jgi:hypothetical protein
MADLDVAVTQTVRYTFRHTGTIDEVRAMVQTGVWPETSGRVEKERLEVFDHDTGYRILEESQT